MHPKYRKHPSYGPEGFREGRGLAVLLGSHGRWPGSWGLQGEAELPCGVGRALQGHSIRRGGGGRAWEGLRGGGDHSLLGLLLM